jgi:hypothetical protein
MMEPQPRTSTVTVIVTPGQLLGLTLCQVSNNVNDIGSGLIEDLNKVSPGSVEVGDRIMEVNGEEGPAFLLIRKFVGSLSGGPGTLRLTILRPVEFDVAINISDGKELGLNLMDVGFVQAVSGEGMVAAHNAKQRSLGAPCLREGDRVVQVSGREPSSEDGASGNVLPYLRLAMCGGASPLYLRVRRGEYVPTPADNSKRVENVSAKAGMPASQKYASCFQNVFKPGAALAQKVKAFRNLGRLARKPERPSINVLAKIDSKHARSDSKVCEEPSTPSTRGPSSVRSQSSDMDAEDVNFVPVPALTLPGIVRRVA